MAKKGTGLGAFWSVALIAAVVGFWPKHDAVTPKPEPGSSASAFVQPTTAPSTPSYSAPAPTPSVPAPVKREVRYINGHSVPFRATPDAKGKILDRLDNGIEVEELRRQEGWALIKHPVKGNEGWVSTQRLSATKPEETAKQKERDEELKPPSQVRLSSSAIAKLLIAASIADYPSNCACPYHRDRAGHSCGKRSAYSRPGGYSPLCYEGDVTPEMVASYRAGKGQ